MNTPDAGRIRVRWYAIHAPPPGVYPLSDYASSDWDSDPKSYDPVIGEESTTRTPFLDWRDCCPPPWQEQFFNACQTVVSLTAPAYAFEFPATITVGPGATLAGPYTINADEECFWSNVFTPDGYDPCGFGLSFGGDGQALLDFNLAFDGTPYLPCAYRSRGPVDATQPFRVYIFEDDADLGVWPKELLLTPSYPCLLAVDACTFLLVGQLDAIIVTCPRPLRVNKTRVLAVGLGRELQV